MDCRCPLKLEKSPPTPCPEGKLAVDLQRQGLTGGCPWFIADREANYCFFKYAQDQGNKPTPPHKIAQKLMIDDSEVKKITSAFKKKMALSGGIE